MKTRLQSTGVMSIWVCLRIAMTVKRLNDKPYLVPLNPDDALSQVRTQLKARSIMSADDCFSTPDGAEILFSDEATFNGAKTHGDED